MIHHPFSFTPNFLRFFPTFRDFEDALGDEGVGVVPVARASIDTWNGGEISTRKAQDGFKEKPSRESVLYKNELFILDIHAWDLRQRSRFGLVE